MFHTDSMDFVELVKGNEAFYKTIEPRNSNDSYTVIATINDYDTKKLIALATGTQANLKKYPDDIEDCHAESLLKRAYKRFVIDQISHIVSNFSPEDDIGAAIRKTIPTNLILFISQFPCGVIQRYGGDNPIVEGTLMKRKPGRGTLINGKVVYVKRDTCAHKLSKWIENGLQGFRLKSIFNIESRIKQILIGSCEIDENLNYKTYMEQFKQIIKSDNHSIDVDLLSNFRRDEFVFNPLKLPQPEAIVWWASVTNDVEKEALDVKQASGSNGNIEHVVDGRRRGLTKQQISHARGTNQRLDVSTFRLREDIASFAHRFNRDLNL